MCHINTSHRTNIAPIFLNFKDKPIYKTRIIFRHLFEKYFFPFRKENIKEFLASIIKKIGNIYG